MDQQRRATIIHEIKYWKDNHLLPSHYCDFLLALYTEGTGATDDALDDLLPKDASSGDSALSMLIPHLFSLLMISIVPLLLSVLLLMDFPIAIEITIILGGIIVVSIFYMLSQHVKVFKVNYSRALYFISLVLAGLYVSGLLTNPFLYRSIMLVFMIVVGVSLGLVKKDRWLLLISGLMFVLGVIGLVI